MWLHANGITMEHTSDIVYEGKLIGEESYPQRAEKNQELEISVELENGIVCSAKIDFFDAKNGVKADYGIIEYPKIRQTERVELLDEDIVEVESWVADAARIVGQEICPPKLPVSKCKSCSYFDFCWVGED